MERTSKALELFDTGKVVRDSVVEAFAYDTRKFNDPQTVKACLCIGTDPPAVGRELSLVRRLVYNWRKKTHNET